LKVESQNNRIMIETTFSAGRLASSECGLRSSHLTGRAFSRRLLSLHFYNFQYCVTLAIRNVLTISTNNRNRVANDYACSGVEESLLQNALTVCPHLKDRPPVFHQGDWRASLDLAALLVQIFKQFNL